MSDPSPSGETWVCRANPAVYGVCTSPIGAIPGHNGCGPVPSSDTPSDERRPVDVTALPEWAALLAAHAEAVKAEEALDQALATGSSYNDPQEPFRVAAARWSRVSLMASSLIHAAAADRGDRADG